jgi:hypothetical protein
MVCGSVVLAQRNVSACAVAANPIAQSAVAVRSLERGVILGPFLQEPVIRADLQNDHSENHAKKTGPTQA